MCNDVLGFILMLTTKSKLKTDVDSRQFSSCGFQMALMRGLDGDEWGRGKDTAASHRGWGVGGSRASFLPLTGPEQHVCFSPKIAFKLQS